uniref:Variant surface glycoprotein 323 n=1 Tax=Trypanosoma brucei TaxID=5691 RepID=M4SWU1_9TRYP|nr:variant surface glycoprotein 323 [Trypanosoma brucei]
MFKRQKKPQAMLLVAIWAMFVSTRRHVSPAAPSKGENRGPFGLLCAVVLSTEERSAAAAPEQAARDAAQNAQFMSLIIEQPAAITRVASLITDSKPTPDDNDAIPTACQKDKLARCAEAAKYFKGLPEAEKQKLLQAASDGRGFKQKINSALKKIINVAQTEKSFSNAVQNDPVKDHLIEAVYGEKAAASVPKLLGSGTDRQSHCGKGDTAPGTSASKSIAATIACLCNSDGTADNNYGCSTTKTGQQTWNQNSDIAQWSTIVANCRKEYSNGFTKRRKMLDQIGAALVADLYTVKGTNKKIGIIGSIHGQGNGHCDGDEASEKGACASFRSGATTISPPTWLTALAAAAKAESEISDQQSSVDRAASQIHAINESLTTLLNLNAMEALKQPAGSAHPPQAPPGDSKRQQSIDSKEAECNKKESDKDCKPPCKWDKEEKDEKKRCTLSEEGKQVEKETTVAGTGDGTAGRIDKCSEAKTPEYCAKITGIIPQGKKAFCGWITYIEGTGPVTPGCRSSSFIVNKKFPLMVSAFMALLF